MDIRQLLKNKNFVLAIVIILLIITLAVILLIATRKDTGQEVGYNSIFNAVQGSDSGLDSDKIMVHIKGAVLKPNVYALPRTARLQELVELAGGLAPNADLDGVNLAQFLSDGSDYTIPEKRVVDRSKTEAEDNRINMSTASHALLTTLEGIGAVTATKIIEYREENGPFTKKEQLIEAGLTEKRLAAIEDKIRLN